MSKSDYWMVVPKCEGCAKVDGLLCAAYTHPGDTWERYGVCPAYTTDKQWEEKLNAILVSRYPEYKRNMHPTQGGYSKNQRVGVVS